MVLNVKMDYCKLSMISSLLSNVCGDYCSDGVGPQIRSVSFLRSQNSR